MKGDLHLHSSCSDGLYDPRAVGAAVRDAGFDFASLADHNTIDGLPEFERSLSGTAVRTIAGIEFSTSTDDPAEMHILGYGFDTACPLLIEAIQEVRTLKHRQLRTMIGILRSQGIQIEDEEEKRVLARLGRPFLAELLIRKGVVSSRFEAFNKYLGTEGCAYAPLEGFGPRDCIERIHGAGGLAVLAHPTIELLDRAICVLCESGLDGVEVYRPGLGGNEELYIEMVTEHFGLLAVGGSDWHGHEGETPLGGFAFCGEAAVQFLSHLSSQ